MKIMKIMKMRLLTEVKSGLGALEDSNHDS